MPEPKPDQPLIDPVVPPMRDPPDQPYHDPVQPPPATPEPPTPRDPDPPGYTDPPAQPPKSGRRAGPVTGDPEWRPGANTEGCRAA